MRSKLLILLILLFSNTIMGNSSSQRQPARAKAHINDLRFSSYCTSHHVEQLATNKDLRKQAWETIQNMGITKIYLEVYRNGHIVSEDHLTFMRDWLQEKDIEVVGGIATVPGGNVGVRQVGPLHWFNWQNLKTRNDLERIIRSAAHIFDTFIVDDFLCTGDVSDESKMAKKDRSWSEYRRVLIAECAQSIFLGPAKEVNPNITMIIKYPQWYDRFHLFGYDTITLPQIFDQVWVGTESRGRNTQRFGFVQPYEGFINYRWLASVAGDKIGGAWFDHGDCAEYDFLDQAYMSVLAGASELVFFNFANIMNGHPDHKKIVAEFDQLANLAVDIREHPVRGIPSYKPPNSDPAGDMYLLDFLGMLGIPLIPVHEFPADAPIVFLPAQAAVDDNLFEKINHVLARGTSLVLTTNLLITSTDKKRLARMIGINPDIKSNPIQATLLSTSSPSQRQEQTTVMVDLESPLELEVGPGDIVCDYRGKKVVLLKTFNTLRGRITLLNTHTYSQSDFDAVGEVLLCPRPLGLLEIDKPFLSILRAVFGNCLSEDYNKTTIPTVRFAVFNRPSCVTYHPLDLKGSGNCVIQNFNNKPVKITLTMGTQKNTLQIYVEAFSGKSINTQSISSLNRRKFEFTIPARDRIWFKRVDDYRYKNNRN